MRLGIVSHKLFYQTGDAFGTTGGFGRYVEALLPYFESVELCVPVAQADSVERRYRVQADRLTITALPPYQGRKGWRLKLDYLKALPTIVATIYRRWSHWDIVHPMWPSYVGIVGLLLARLTRKPCFVYVGGDASRMIVARRDTLLRRLRGYLLDVLIRHLTHGLPTFISGRELFAKIGRGNPMARVCHTSTLWEEDIVDELPPPGPKGAQPRLLYVGRIDQAKGLVYLVEAVAELRRRDVPVHLDLVGEGPFLPELERTIASLAIDHDITSHGFVPLGEALFSFYRRADVFVLPSLSEGMPKVLLEAMANGAAVVATRVGGIPSVVEHGVNGLLVEPASVADLVQALEQLIDDPEMRARLAANGLETARARALSAEMSRRMRILEGLLPLVSSTGQTGALHV